MRKHLLFSFVFIVQFVSAQDTTRLSMIFIGDIMQHDSQIADAYDPVKKTYDYSACFQHIKPYLQSVDLAFGNLEVTLAGPPYKGYPQFSAPDQLLTALKNVGMDVLVTANNHCVDRGKKGLERTVQLLDSFRIEHTGTFVNAAEKAKTYPLLIEKNGFRLSLLNYTYGTNGLPVTQPNIVNMIDKDEIKKDLAKAKKMNTDAVIVMVHWGSEYQSLPNAYQKDIAKLFFDQGADIVIGAHPHVVQPMEWYKKHNRFIAYSLGNFVSGQRKRYTDGGAMVRLELEKVRVNDTLSVTKIDTAGYILEWVYRTADREKNYFILPAPMVAKTAASYISDDASRVAFKTFVDDSRALFSKYNIAVPELNSAADYAVEFNAGDSLQVRQFLEEQSGVRLIKDQLNPRFQLGPMTQPDALFLQERVPVEGTILHLKE